MKSVTDGVEHCLTLFFPGLVWLSESLRWMRQILGLLGLLLELLLCLMRQRQLHLQVGRALRAAPR